MARLAFSLGPRFFLAKAGGSPKSSRLPSVDSGPRAQVPRQVPHGSQPVSVGPWRSCSCRHGPGCSCRPAPCRATPGAALGAVSPLCPETLRETPAPPSDQHSRGSRPCAPAGGRDQAPGSKERPVESKRDQGDLCPGHGALLEPFPPLRPSRWTLPPGSLPVSRHRPGSHTTPGTSESPEWRPLSSELPAPSGLPVTGSLPVASLGLLPSLSRPGLCPPPLRDAELSAQEPDSAGPDPDRVLLSG